MAIFILDKKSPRRHCRTIDAFAGRHPFFFNQRQRTQNMKFLATAVLGIFLIAERPHLGETYPRRRPGLGGGERGGGRGLQGNRQNDRFFPRPDQLLPVRSEKGRAGARGHTGEGSGEGSARGQVSEGQRGVKSTVDFLCPRCRIFCMFRGKIGDIHKIIKYQLDGRKPLLRRFAGVSFQYAFA